MSRLTEDFEKQLKNLNRGISFMDKEAILFHEINLQLKIFSIFIIIGVLMMLLAILL